MIFRTVLCDVLAIEYPIIQSGMGGVAGPELVAEVCRAGGLGVLAGLNVPPDELRALIRRVRALTDRPFGVNLWLHSALRPPVDPASVPDETLAAVQGTLNRFRVRLGIPAAHGRPPAAADHLPAALRVIVDERVPVFSAALGRLEPEIVADCHRSGVKVLAMVASVADARTAAAAGADVIVAQGGEAGGHRSVDGKPASPEPVSIATMALVPQVVEAVGVPVVAAGGVAEGRGLVAALALGASGIMLGTRFVATRESLVPEFWKKRILESESEATTLTDAFSGLWARALVNTFSRDYAAARAPVLPPLVQRNAAGDVYAAASQQGDGEYFPMWAGQSVGLIRDLPGAAEVVQSLVREAGQALTALHERVQVAAPAPRRDQP
jgi:nitronate monooxygenase